MKDKSCAACDHFVLLRNLQDGRLVEQTQCWFDPPRTSIMVIPPAVVGGQPQQATVTVRNYTTPDNFCGRFAQKEAKPIPAASSTKQILIQ